jgi:TolB-like protein/class 3 adenylate cyclase/Tfp pilus assembly protein PilF
MMRRLAAIIDADVVGYSRLMSLDETATFARLKALRSQLLAPRIAEHGGRVVKLIGDGTLAEFASVVDAVACAVDIQLTMLELEPELEPERRLRLRIGVHLGDLLVENEDIFGDGVNVAAGLQALAPPGGICISHQVHDQIASKLVFNAADLGERQLENIPGRVRVWRWSPDDAQQPQPVTHGGDLHSTHRSRPSVAVLPFVNMSDLAEQEHFSDGFTEELIATLARCRWLLVAARNSSFTYKGRSVDTRRAAQDLHVRYVLEGSVRRAENRVRVTAQLLRGKDGTLLWAERYDRTLGDIFVVQDEIASEITGAIEPELGVIEFAALRGRTDVDMDAWDIYLKGLWHLYKFTLDDLLCAKELFEQAISVDPSFAQAHARLAYAHIQLGWYGEIKERADRIRNATALSERAIRLDNREPAAYLALGRALALGGAPQTGITHLRHALTLDFSFAQAHFALGQALCYVERPEEGVAEIKQAFRLSPRDPHLWTFHTMLAIADYQLGRMNEAALAARAALREKNVTFWPAMVLVAILGRQQKTTEAREAIVELKRFRPDINVRTARMEFYFGDLPVMPTPFIERFIVDLVDAGLPGE